MRLLIFALIIPFLFLGCTRDILVSAALPCPAPLEIPRAEPAVKAMINALRRTDAKGGNQQDRDLYEFFKRRADLQKARRNRLQNICRSTHE